MKCEIQKVTKKGDLTTVKGWFIPLGYTCKCKKQDFEIEVHGNENDLEKKVIDILTFIR